MATEIYMPQLGLTMDAGVVLRWLKREGEWVDQGEPVLEVESDKATLEIEAAAEGVVYGIVAAEGDTVPVGQVMAYILEKGERPPPGEIQARPREVETGERVPDDATLVAAGPARRDEAARPPSSPLARKLAAAEGIDIRSVEGTGPGGRVTQEDILRVARAEQGRRPSSVAPVAYELQALSAIKRETARRMAESYASIPQFSLERQVDLAALQQFREAQTSAPEREGSARISLTAYCIKACALALREHPGLNAEYTPEGVRLYQRVNLGVAVGTPQGLIVPVIHDADGRSLGFIQQQLVEFKARAEHMRFPVAMLAQGTFTLSNLGMFGVDRFTPIINPPQSALLAVGRLRSVPVEGERGAARWVPAAAITLVVDHRAIDGLQGAKFLETFAALVEDPSRLEGER